jgi:hypothetical protein
MAWDEAIHNILANLFLSFWELPWYLHCMYLRYKGGIFHSLKIYVRKYHVLPFMVKIYKVIHFLR